MLIFLFIGRSVDFVSRFYRFVLFDVVGEMVLKCKFIIFFGEIFGSYRFVVALFLFVLGVVRSDIEMNFFFYF